MPEAQRTVQVYVPIISIDPSGTKIDLLRKVYNAI